MKKMRILSLALVVIMLLSCCPLSAFATSPSGNTMTLSVETVSARPGESVEVKLNLSNNSGIASIAFDVTYDELLTLDNVTFNTEGLGASAMVTAREPYSSPQRLSIATPTSVCSFNGTIATLQFTVSDEAEEGDESVITITYDEDNVFDANLDNVPLTVENGMVAVHEYVPGDVNGDGSVNNKDAVLLFRYVAGWQVEIVNPLIDLNGDGSVNNKDAVLLFRYCAGWDVPIPRPLPVSNHTLVKTDAVEATCTESGNIAYWYCSDCGKYFSNAKGTKEISADSITIPAKGHTVVIDPAIPPTSTEVGWTEGSHCSVCGIVIVQQEPIEPPESNKYTVIYNIGSNDKYLSQLSVNNPNENYYTAESGLVLQDLMVDGYNFKGWYTASTGGTKVTEIPVGSTGTKYLYAQWEKVPYTIQFDSPDVPIESTTYKVDEGKTLVKPTLFGYTFVGWSIDGEIVNNIPVGSTGNITLHANWTSNRNKAKSVSKLETPNVIEDLDNGQYLFVYRIGTIDNVPLATGKENVINTEGINLSEEITLNEEVSSTTADRIAKTVSNATTKSSAWTLSEDWNESTAATNSHDEQIGKTKARTDSEGSIVAGKYYVSNSQGGSTTVSSSVGGSTTNSSKVTTDYSRGINSEYGYEVSNGRSVTNTVTNSNEKEFNWNLGGSIGGSNKKTLGGSLGGSLTQDLGQGLKAGLSAGLTAGLEKVFNWSVNGGIGGKNTTTNTTSHTTQNTSNVKKTANTADSRNYSIGTDRSTTSEGHWENSQSSTSTWNSTSGYEKSSQTSQNTTISSTLSEVIYDRYQLTSATSRGGNNSESRSTADTSALSDEYASTVEFSKDNSKSEKKTVSYNSSATGYFRLVTAGTLHVFGVVGYDIATQSYFTYTYNVLDKERHSYLDYSMDNANFNDCENGIIPFEIPYDVEEYISVKIGRSSGLTINENTGMVTKYTGSAEYVVIPEYISATDGLNQPKAVRVSGIESSVFRNNQTIKGVLFPKYIEEIPDNAFEGCSSLETVIGDGISRIGENAFKDCVSMDTFLIDEFVTSLGEHAFENTIELYVNASNSDVAKAALKSGTKNLLVYLSNMDGSINNESITIPAKTDFFALMSNAKAYKNLTIESNAKHTFLSNFKLTDNEDIPLRLNSEKVTLSRIIVDDSPGLAMVLPKENTELKLYGNVMLSSQDENVLMSKNVSLSYLNTDIDANLNLSGNYLVSGNLVNDQNVTLNYTSGRLIHITDEDFDKYLTKVDLILDANGGEVASSQKTVYYGQKYGELPTPTRAKYVFDGWFTEPIGGNKVTATTVMDKLTSQTLYAHWILNEYTINFDVNAEDAVLSVTEKKAVFGENLGELPTPTRDYYTFKGWFTDATGGFRVNKDSILDNDGDLTFYAHWELNPLSDWVLESDLPDDAKVENEKWSYDLTSYTTTSSSSLVGWTLYDTRYTYKTQYRKRTRSRSTVYHYWRYAAQQYGGMTYNYQEGGTSYYSYTSSSELAHYDSYGGGTYKYWYNNGNNFFPVLKANPFTTYNYGAWSGWSAWQDAKISSSDTVDVQTQQAVATTTYYYSKTEEKEATSDPTGQTDVSNVQKWVQYRAK